jgi:hypothetical protein
MQIAFITCFVAAALLTARAIDEPYPVTIATACIMWFAAAVNYLGRPRR